MGAVAVPQQPRAEARQQGRDAGDEIESAEAGRPKVGRGGVGDHPREDALGQRHVRAPQRNSDDQAGEFERLGEDQVGDDQHGHTGHQDRPWADAVAEAARRISEREEGQVERHQHQRRQRRRQACVIAAQDQEAFREAGEREQEADREQAPHRPVELAEAGEDRRARGRAVIARLLLERQPGEQEAEQRRDRRHPEHRSDIAGEPDHQPDRRDRRDHRPDGVERLAQAERAAANLGRRFVGDHPVARRAADALADPVGEARAHHFGGARGEREQRLRQSGQAITGEDPRLAPGGAVGQPARGKLGEGSGGLGNAVDRAERCRRKPERHGDEQAAAARDKSRSTGPSAG